MCQAKSSIGAFTYFRSNSRINGLTIGSFCSVAPNFTFGDGQHPLDFLSTHPFQYKGVKFSKSPAWQAFQTSVKSPKQKKPGTIGSDVWIGANVTVMRGVNIGHGAVIGAGSIVTRDVKPYEIVAGVPARHLRFRFPRNQIKQLLALEWWNYTLSSLQGVPFDSIKAAIAELEKRKKAGRLELRDRAFDLYVPPVIVSQPKRNAL